MRWLRRRLPRLVCKAKGKATAMEPKKKYRINTYGWGVFYRWAKSAIAARNRVAYAVFGPGYEGWEHEYWEVEEVTA